jgi:hypothetical protein
MKALLVIGSEVAHKLVSFYVRPLGFEIIRYRQALKAMDNVDEVDPDAVIVSAEDFPRHWKTLVQFIRSERATERTVIVILKGSHFPFEEAAKAAYIGVNGIVSENLDDPEELDRLQGILGRYAPVHEGRAARRVRPADWDRIEFVYTRPDDQSIVTGRVESISVNGLAFLPEQSAAVEALEPGMELFACSLRAGDAILSPSCRVVRVDRTIALSFTTMDDEERAVLERYLLERPLRERKHLG